MALRMSTLKILELLLTDNPIHLYHQDNHWNNYIHYSSLTLLRGKVTLHHHIFCAYQYTLLLHIAIQKVCINLKFWNINFRRYLKLSTFTAISLVGSIDTVELSVADLARPDTPPVPALEHARPAQDEPGGWGEIEGLETPCVDDTRLTILTYIDTVTHLRHLCSQIRHHKPATQIYIFHQNNDNLVPDKDQLKRW